MAVRCGCWTRVLPQKWTCLLNWPPQNCKTPCVPTPTTESWQKKKQVRYALKRQANSGPGVWHIKVKQHSGQTPWTHAIAQTCVHIHTQTHQGTHAFMTVPVNTKSQGMALWILISGFSPLITDPLMTAECLTSSTRKTRGWSQFSLCCAPAQPHDWYAWIKPTSRDQTLTLKRGEKQCSYQYCNVFHSSLFYYSIRMLFFFLLGCCQIVLSGQLFKLP